jgi:hypothetical protein
LMKFCLFFCARHTCVLWASAAHPWQKFCMHCRQCCWTACWWHRAHNSPVELELLGTTGVAIDALWLGVATGTMLFRGRLRTTWPLGVEGTVNGGGRLTSGAGAITGEDNWATDGVADANMAMGVKMWDDNRCCRQARRAEKHGWVSGWIDGG